MKIWMRGNSQENWPTSFTLAKSGDFAKGYGLKDQIQRAAVSVMNNVSEGFEHGSNKDFAELLFIARGAVDEVRSMLYLALDQKYITDTLFKEAHRLCVREARLCGGTD